MSTSVSLPVKRRHPLVRREAIVAYLFILPTLLGFLVFQIGPMLAGLGLSFFSWDVFSPPQFVGLQNFSQALSDPLLSTTLKNTTVFVLLAEPFNIGLGLLIACGIDWLRIPWLKAFLRTTYFLPIVMSAAVISLLWKFLMQTDLGVLNYFLSLIHIAKVPWLNSSHWAMISVVLVDVWRNVGFFVLIFLARLQSIPTDLYEAAEVDGANEFVRFLRITLPMMSPTIFFSTIIALIGGFQVFDQMFILTGGGPGDSTRSIVMYIYEEAFRSFRMGYASVISLILFAIIILLTVIQMRLSKRWVFYR